MAKMLLTASTVNGSCITSCNVLVQGIEDWTLYLWTLNNYNGSMTLHLSATMHNELS